jgi:hypothetical protein
MAGKSLGVAESIPNLEGASVNGTFSGTMVIGATAADKVAFYGVTSTTQPTATNQAAAGTVSSVSISATQWGFSTSTQANSLINLVQQIRSDLVALGLIKGS